MSDAYFDYDGNPISLEEWGRLWEADRCIREDQVGAVVVKTVYLGFVEPTIHDARLFGTALTTELRLLFKQIQVYDSQDDAIAGHEEHVQAIRDGFHCHRCRAGMAHD